MNTFIQSFEIKSILIKKSLFRVMYKDYLFSYILYIIKLALELAKKSFCLYTGVPFIKSVVIITNVYFPTFRQGIVILSNLTDL